MKIEIEQTYGDLILQDLHNPEHRVFHKIPRYSREIVITEKIDGTNGVIYVPPTEDTIWVGSKNRWLSQTTDNHGFYTWAMKHRTHLLHLGRGYHYGEWWGKGIQRGYNLHGKYFSLFNTTMWRDEDGVSICPECCLVVPILYQGDFTPGIVEQTLEKLKLTGSMAAPTYWNPEGVVVYHTASGYMFKKTFENDEKGKGR